MTDPQWLDEDFKAKLAESPVSISDVIATYNEKQDAENRELARQQREAAKQAELDRRQREALWAGQEYNLADLGAKGTVAGLDAGQIKRMRLSVFAARRGQLGIQDPTSMEHLG